MALLAGLFHKVEFGGSGVSQSMSGGLIDGWPVVTRKGRYTE